MDNERLLEFLEAEGVYFGIKEIPGRGFCAVHNYLFTTGLLYGLDFQGLEGRYCYKNPVEAVVALHLWDGQGDPPGNWIKHKGRAGEWSNPKYFQSDGTKL